MFFPLVVVVADLPTDSLSMNDGYDDPELPDTSIAGPPCGFGVFFVGVQRCGRSLVSSMKQHNNNNLTCDRNFPESTLAADESYYSYYSASGSGSSAASAATTAESS